jgi:flagellar basal-body rod modification protein FlgD
MTSPVNSLASLTQAQAAANASSSAETSTADTNAAISATDSLGNENTFLQLLVAQIKNQDPTQPVDSSTFLTQLAEFSQLEQMIGIRQDVSELDPTASPTSTSTGASSANGTSGTQS